MSGVEIVPAILVKTPEELEQRIREVEPYIDRIHIDIMDGKFVPNITIQPEDVKIRTNFTKEVHLMVEDNEKYAEDFLNLGFDIIIVHVESCKDVKRIIKMVKERDKRMALALNPSTSISMLNDYLDELDMVLIMSVNPGFSGQSFDLSVLSKIRKLRKKKENLDIEVDGGIKVGTTKLAVKAGANILVSCSAIFGQENKEEAIEALRKEVSSI